LDTASSFTTLRGDREAAIARIHAIPEKELIEEVKEWS